MSLSPREHFAFLCDVQVAQPRTFLWLLCSLSAHTLSRFLTSLLTSHMMETRYFGRRVGSERRYLSENFALVSRGPPLAARATSVQPSKP